MIRMKFFKEEGYTASQKLLLFDKKQLIALLFCIVGSVILFFVMNHSSEKTNLILYRTCVSLNLAIITMRICNYAFIQKNFHWDYGLPFHLCSYNVILCFLAAWTLQPAFMDIVFALSPLPALSALLFPESDAAKYPYFNFRCIEYYLSHTFLVITPFLPICYFGFRPSPVYFSYFIGIFLLMILLAGIVDYFTHGNYMYLNHAPHGTPLVSVETKCGKTVYRILLLSGLIVLYFLMHLFYYFI
jgi:hypothetical integral membrane protein (TIGR02206 family)